MTKIMLVEDDNNLREIYEARLAAEGFDIVSAQDGEAALALAARERPDLVITDVMMPKISGFEMLDILRNTETLRDVKVIMLTALGQAEDNARAGALGADRYLVKSQVTLEDIIKATHEVLNDPADTAQETSTPAASESEAAPEPSPAPESAEQTPAPWETSAPAPTAAVAEEPEVPEPVVADTPELQETAQEPVESTPIQVESPANDPEESNQDAIAPTPDFGTSSPAFDATAPAPMADPLFSAAAPAQPTDFNLPAVPDPTPVALQQADSFSTDDSTDVTVVSPEEEISNAAPAAQEESVIRAQIDQFLDDSSDSDTTDADVDAQPLPTEEVAITPQEPTAPAEEAEEEYEKDAASPDMGELPVHEQEIITPSQPELAAPVAAVEPATVEQAAPAMPTPGYPSQPYELPVAPGAAVGDAAPVAAPEQPQIVEQPVVPPQPVQPPQSAGDQLVSNAINDMSANTPQDEQMQSPEPTEPGEEPQNTESSASDAPSSDDAAPAAHKRVIAPLGFGGRPDINQLLAVEDAKNAANQASAGMASPQAAPYGQPWQQPGQQPPNNNPPVDPNSISL